MLDRILKNPVSTITAIIGAIVGLIGVFGVIIDPDVAAAIVTVIVFVLGIFAKD